MADSGSPKLDRHMYLDVPAHLLKDKASFGLDIGGTLLKAVYTGPEENGIVRVHCVSFSREEVDEALEYIRTNVGQRLKKDEQITTCGFGCSKYMSKINSELNVKINTIHECDCFVKAFMFLLDNFPVHEITHPPRPEVQKYVHDQIDDIGKAVQKMATEHADTCTLKMFEVDDAKSQEQKQDGNKTEPKLESEIQEMKVKDESGSITSDKEEALMKEDIFPCVLAFMGSACGGLKLEADGSQSVADQIVFGGRVFAGLGSMITGARSYSELMDLAARGNHENVDLMGRHLMSEGSTDVYSVVPPKAVVFPFGQVVNRKQEDFRREDLAAGLLRLAGQEIGTSVYQVSVMTGVKHVFVVGSLPGLSQQFRDQFETYFLMRSMLRPKEDEIRVKHHFIKLGSYLGALGAMLTTIDKCP